MTTSGLMLTNSQGPEGFSVDVVTQHHLPIDRIDGQLEINGAKDVVVTGLSLATFSTLVHVRKRWRSCAVSLMTAPPRC